MKIGAEWFRDARRFRVAGFDPSSTLPGHVPGLAGTDLTGKPQIGRNRAQSLGRAHSEIGLSPVRGRVAERVAAGGRRGAPSDGGFEIQKNWGAAWCFRAMRVWSDKCWQCKKWNWPAETPRRNPPKPIW